MIEYFYDTQCDFCVCARHVNYRKPSVLDEYIEEMNIEPNYIPKDITAYIGEQSKSNQKQCSETFEMLMTNINKFFEEKEVR